MVVELTTTGGRGRRAGAGLGSPLPGRFGGLELEQLLTADGPAAGATAFVDAAQVFAKPVP
jgi:hypothetical protein